MMVSFVNEDFLSSDLQGRGVLVVDCNLQGLWETGLLKAMKSVFPKTYRRYMRLCLFGNKDHKLYKAGDAIMFEEDGYKFVFLITKTRRKTDKEEILKNMEQAIKNMMALVPSDIYLYSPVLGREDKCFTETLKIMRRLAQPEMRTWYIYRKNFRSH